MAAKVTAPRQCSHVPTCELYPLFRSKTLSVWQTYYCCGRFETCERYRLALAGKPVPANLLPNGKVLDLRILGAAT